MNRLLSLCGACLLAGTVVSTDSAIATPAPANEHSIQMDRPMKVGQRLRIRAQNLERKTMSRVIDGAPEGGQLDQQAMTFHAECQVKKVDAQGRATEATYTVSKCKLDTGNGVRTIAPEGAVLEATRQGNQTVFKVDGRRLDDEATEALQVFGLSRCGSSDAHFGTSRRRTIGESWDVSRNNVAKELNRQLAFDVNARSLNGTTTLVDATTHDGVPSLVLYSQVTAANATPRSQQVAQGFDVRESNLSATFHAVFPEDVRFPPLVSFESFDVTTSLVGRNGSAQAGAEFQYDFSRFVEVEITPLDPSGQVVTGFDAASEAMQE